MTEMTLASLKKDGRFFLEGYGELTEEMARGFIMGYAKGMADFAEAAAHDFAMKVPTPRPQAPAADTEE